MIVWGLSLILAAPVILTKVRWTKNIIVIMANNTMVDLYNEWYCRILSDTFIFHAKDAVLFLFKTLFISVNMSHATALKILYFIHYRDKLSYYFV